MAGNDKKLSVICHYCHNSVDIRNEDVNEDESIVKCRNWLTSCQLSDSSTYEEESLYSDTGTSTTDNLDEDNMIAVKNDNIRVVDELITENNNEIVELSNIINKKPNNYENIQIYKSKNVHIGDVTHINGPVYINQFTPTINQNIIVNQKTQNSTHRVFIVSRRTWLAQPPLDLDDVQFLKKPVQYVIISHSASEEAYTQTENNLIVRLIQQFHIESRQWNDISYNFLIGADGSIYEGRGWDVVGAHAFRYNNISIGICFVGCYIKKLPPPSAIAKAKAFIKYGVEIGAIAEDYKLLGHCQCSSTESPGRKLFEEIKTWDHWDESVSITNPSPLITQ